MPSTAADLAVYDHLRPADGATVTDVDGATVDPGVYRVVGVGAETATLLRVGDPDGSRVTTGAVTTVDADALERFDPADNPDGNRPLGDRLRGFAADFGWNLRAFFAGLRARPVASVAALALVLVGHQGDRVLQVSETWLTVVYFLGVLGLVYLGSRGG